MGELLNLIAYPLGVVMNWCFSFINNYGLAIIAFTLLTKVILLPISVWVQKNSIKMVKMQPDINRIKAKYFGDNDTIAVEESKLYKKYKYSPLATLIPLAIQILLLLGVIGVIYNPFEHIFNMPTELSNAINLVAAGLTNQSVESSSIQLTAVECIKNPEYYDAFAALGAQFKDIDVAFYLTQIKNFDLNFLGINLSHNPSVVYGITIIVPIIAGCSSYLLCICQNKANVLQSEQSKAGQWGTLIFSVGLSLVLGFLSQAPPILL